MIGGLAKKGLREDFIFWSEMGVDYMQVNVPFDYFLDEKNIYEIISLREEFDTNIIFHPMPDGEKLLSPANPESHDTIIECLKEIKNIIVKEGLINKVIMHLSTYHIPDSHYPSYQEDEAIRNSKKFYDKLYEFNGLNLVFENGYPPGISWDELGYKPDHFNLFKMKREYELCLDTGHLNLNDYVINDFLELPYNLTCIHLQSNNGREDQHYPLTKQNFNEWRQLERLLSKDKYMTIEAKNGLEDIRNIVEHLKENKIAD